MFKIVCYLCAIYYVILLGLLLAGAYNPSPIVTGCAFAIAALSFVGHAQDKR